MDLQIDKILYKRKTFDSGVILGTREHIFDLSMSKSPCKAKDKDGKRLVSKITPHRKNPVIYIPDSLLEKGFIFRVTRRDNEKEPVKETVYEVLEKGLNFVTVQVLEVKNPDIRKKKKPGNLEELTKNRVNNPFERWDLSDTQRQRQKKDLINRCTYKQTVFDTSKDLLEFNGKIYQKKTAFCFIYDVQGKKKRGSVFQKVSPDLIFDESFIFAGQEYHILTGLPVGVIAQQYKITPRYKEV